MKKTVAGPAGRDTTEAEIGGRKFWKRESREKVPAGKVQSVSFATAMNGYILQFDIDSFDGGFTKHLEHCIEAIRFFEPSKAEEVAGPNSRPYRPSLVASAGDPSNPTSSRVSQLDPGEVVGNTYKNNALGFEYQLPSGWVVNDKAIQDRTMEAGHQFAWGDSPRAAREHEQFKRCARVLLFVTKYPEGAKIKEFNPVIVVIAADSNCLGGTRFPASVDDTDAIRQVGQEFVRTMAGTPFVAKGHNSVDAFTVQDHLIVELSTKFSVSAPSRDTPVTVFTSLELTQAKDYWVMWGFMSGTEAELEEVKRTQIKFTSQTPISPSAQ